MNLKESTEQDWQKVQTMVAMIFDERDVETIRGIYALAYAAGAAYAGQRNIEAVTEHVA